MSGAHLTVRLPAALARHLARRAREAGVARSHVVRAAVVAYLSGPRAPARVEVAAAEVAERWSRLPRLSPEEAAALGEEIEAARAALPAPSTWE